MLRESTLFSQDSVNIIVDNEQEDLGELDDDKSDEEDNDGEEEVGEDDIPKEVLHPLLEKLIDQCCGVWFV